MSYPSKSMPDSIVQSSTIPGLTALTEKLQEAAQALLDVSQSSGDHDDSDESEVLPESATGDLKPPFEIHSSEIPDYTLRDEQDFLIKTNSPHLHDALNKIYRHINNIAHLMPQYTAEEYMNGVIFN